uniref:Uncharacterized protein n=1 Tax=Avena sativa TaxID=4498 RepID=A0ACD5ZHQ0_AVESA
MRVLRDRQNCACAAVQQVHGHTFPPMAQPSSLNVVKELLNDLELHLMILVSFGLQVFLLFTAGLRRRGAPHFLRSLIWLAYLLADSVAIFVLGHLAVKASGARHQLLLFWAPFVLLHLGGQHTITAFSMQDNKLWKRHVLEFVSHLGMACYIVSRSSWPDKELQSAMVFMMIVGYFKYAERTMCVIFSNPNMVKFKSGLVYYEMLTPVNDDHDLFKSDNRRIPIDCDEMEARLNEMCKPAVGDMKLRPSSRFPWQMVLSSTPLNYPTTVECTDALPVLLQEFKQKGEVLRRCASLRGKKKNTCHLYPAYNYVGALLCAIYEHLYTKALLFHSTPAGHGRLPHSSSSMLLVKSLLPIALLLYPVFLILMALVLFKASMKNDHNQIYSLADVVVSYILLIGALILEATSIFAWLSSYTVLTQEIQCGCLTPLVSRVVRYIHSAAWLRRKQWSETLGQHSRIKAYTRREGIMSFVPGCIASCLYNKTLTQKPLSEDLKKLVLNKLLDFGIGGQQYWNFASTRGKLALLKRIDLAGPGTHLHKSINNVDFITSLLIWHIATDICYYREDTSITNNTKEKKMCQELSYYIMYLVFDCNVLLTSTANTIDAIAYKELDIKFKKLQTDNLSVKQAIKFVFEDEQEERQPAADDMASSNSQPVHQGVREAIESEIISEANAEDGHQPTNTASNRNQPLNHVEHLRSTMDTIRSRVLPRACEVAKELISIDKEVAWDLIADVWLEMLYYVAPRCGGEFHHDHLSTGGEFITHVLLLMHELGPFLPPPADLVY